MKGFERKSSNFQSLRIHVKIVNSSISIPEYINVYARIVNSMGLDLKGPKIHFGDHHEPP